MKAYGKSYKALWFENEAVYFIDQSVLPFSFLIKQALTLEDAAGAIKNMTVRGAPIIGAMAAYGIYLGIKDTTEKLFNERIQYSAKLLKSTRPTAVNLFHAVDTMLSTINQEDSLQNRKNKILAAANIFYENEIKSCQQIGIHGSTLIEEIYAKTQKPVQILTHCNAGWLACGDYGTALAPIYEANKKGIPIHVWVDETRPRNQGINLTAWELFHEKIPFTIITDNTGGLLMQMKKIDLAIVGSDRTALNGDVANKIGTYLKALAAFDNQIPFYVALPSSTIDFSLESGIGYIPIEQRNDHELSHIKGFDMNNNIAEIQIIPDGFPVANYAFDITPAKYISALITEKGIYNANKESILTLYNQLS